MALIGTHPSGAKIIIEDTHSAAGFRWEVVPPFDGHSQPYQDWDISEAKAKRSAMDHSLEATKGHIARWKWSYEVESKESA